MNFESLKTKNEIEILEIIDKYHETIKRAIKEIRPDIITNCIKSQRYSTHITQRQRFLHLKFRVKELHD